MRREGPKQKKSSGRNILPGGFVALGKVSFYWSLILSLVGEKRLEGWEGSQESMSESSSTNHAGSEAMGTALPVSTFYQILVMSSLCIVGIPSACLLRIH